MRCDPEFLCVYRYCAKALKDGYQLNIINYSYELYLSYLNAKRTFDTTRNGTVTFPLWVFWYLKGRIKDARISENLKNRIPPNHKTTTHIDEDAIELKDTLDKYDGALLYDHYIQGETLKDIAASKSVSLSTIHNLKKKTLERVKMNVDLQEYYDTIPISEEPFLLLVKASGDLLGHIVKVKTTEYMDMPLLLKDLSKVLWYVVSILKSYKLPIDSTPIKTMDVVEDILYLVCHANKIVDGDNKNTVRHSLYNIVGLLDSIANRSGSSLKELALREDFRK